MLADDPYAITVQGRIKTLTKARAPSGSRSTIDEALRPARVINAITIETASGVETIKGPFVTYPACDPHVAEGFDATIRLFKPTPEGVFFDGSRPLMAVEAIETGDIKASDKGAITATLERIRKSIAMDVGNKWFLGAMVIMFAVFLYDVYKVSAGISETLNPEAALWGFVAPGLLLRTLWFHRRKKQVENLLHALNDS